jgi:hypothetical protein
MAEDFRSRKSERNAERSTPCPHGPFQAAPIKVNVWLTMVLDRAWSTPVAAAKVGLGGERGGTGRSPPKAPRRVRSMAGRRPQDSAADRAARAEAESVIQRHVPIWREKTFEAISSTLCRNVARPHVEPPRSHPYDGRSGAAPHRCRGRAPLDLVDALPQRGLEVDRRPCLAAYRRRTLRRALGSRACCLWRVGRGRSRCPDRTARACCHHIADQQ